MSHDPDSTRLYLIRHGRVDERWHGRIYGGLDVPLSELGRRQALRAARILEAEQLDAVLSSGLERAEYGAALVREPRQLERRDVPALTELDRGDWAGLTFAELEERAPGAWAAWLAAPDRERPQGGESLEDLARRVLPVCETLVQEYPAGALAVVAHSWVIRVLACRVLGLGPGRAPSLDLPPGGIVAVDWPVGEGRGGGARRPVLAGFNLEAVPDRATPWRRGPYRA